MKFSKKQGIQHATRKSTRGLDAKKLDFISAHLMTLNRSIGSIRNLIIHNEKFGTKNKNRETDLLLNNIIHLQHDTVKIHGELGFETEKTIRRNADYLRAKLPLIIINQDLAKSCNLDEGNLTEYLFYHKLSELNAEEYL